MKVITENELRLALGNAFSQYNAETIATRDPEERLLYNKLALDLVKRILNELKIEVPNG